MLNLVSTLIGPVSNLLDKFVEDKDQKNDLAHQIATIAEKQAHESTLAQIEVNKTEAQHRSIWVAGWRPFIGWGCGIALAYHFVFNPILVFALVAAGFPESVWDLPEFDMSNLMTVLLGMLGLGGLRTFEKHKGIAK